MSFKSIGLGLGHYAINSSASVGDTIFYGSYCCKWHHDEMAADGYCALDCVLRPIFCGFLRQYDWTLALLLGHFPTTWHSKQHTVFTWLNRPLFSSSFDPRMLQLSKATVWFQGQGEKFLCGMVQYIQLAALQCRQRRCFLLPFHVNLRSSWRAPKESQLYPQGVYVLERGTQNIQDTPRQ